MASPTISPIDHLPEETAKELGLLGLSPAYSCLTDPRFSYYLYVPKNYFRLNRDGTSTQLLVLIHGSSRDPYRLRARFEAFAEAHNVFLLCPLFPIGFLDPTDTDNYKMIKYYDVRYDHVLLSMVAEVGERFPRLIAERFFLYGFSGGGQFVHRFAYLHPHRLEGLVCGAPGTQTHWNREKDFPAGVRDLEDVFGGIEGLVDDRWDILRRVPTLFICGDEDTDIAFLKLRARSMEGWEGGRLGAVQRLEQSWKVQNADSRFLAVKGAAHEERKMIAASAAFFGDLLLQQRTYSLCSDEGPRL